MRKRRQLFRVNNVLVALSVVVMSLLAAPVFAQTRHTFKPAVGHPTFAAREPVLRIKPGDIVETETLWGQWYEREGGAWPGEVGPFYIEGAAPGDTLVVKILSLRVNRDVAVARHNPTFGTLMADQYTPMLTDPAPPRRFIWRIDRRKNTATLELPGSRLGQVEVPLVPMLGRMATAPRGQESWPGLWPSYFGGNMDSSDARQGATVYLPVFHEGALFYFGDVHALQGDGELAGTGLETTAEVAFQFDLIKGKRVGWPRIENNDFIMVAGSGRPLIDALRVAYVELIEWLVDDYDFDRWEAYQLVSQVTVMRVANAVDPYYTVMAKFPKKYLPK